MRLLKSSASPLLNALIVTTIHSFSMARTPVELNSQMAS